MHTANAFWTFILGWACVVPAALPPDQSHRTQEEGILAQLQQEWTRTLAALENLRGVEQQLAAGKPPPLGQIREYTEPARWSLDEAGSQLVQLSRSVRELEDELQALRTRPPRRPLPDDGALSGLNNPDQRPSAATLGTRQGAPLPGSASGTTGLDGNLRERQANGLRQRGQSRGSVSPTAPVLPAQVTQTSARAAYLAGDYANALVQFQRLPDSPAVRHWIARSLERLGRSAEALERYDALAKDPAAATYGQRAEQDAGFLRWKLALNTAAPQTPKAP